MNITELLAQRAYNRLSESNSDLFNISEDPTEFSFYLKDIYKLLQSENYYSFGVRNLCFACDNALNDELNKSLLEQCIYSSRIFQYKDMLRERGLVFEDEGLLELSQKAFYSIESDLILTKEQKDLYDLFMKKRRLVISAPTSFGKSRIIREIINNANYHRVAVVVPTNALLSETYFSFRADERFKDYSLVFSTHIEPPKKKVIYIFTPEKFDVYTDEHKIDFDFFVFDEVYKIDSSDGRSSVFSNCLYKAYLKKCDYYLIGPYFKRFSKKFLEKTDGIFKRFETDIVQKQLINYLSDSVAYISGKELRALKGKDSRLRRILKEVDGQTIVYVSRKDSAETRAKLISESKNKSIKNNELTELINYIKKNISKNWRLVDFLSKGVAFHHAGVPKYIQTEIVDLFNSGIIDVIVCTPTLTEGVNTTAKNVVFYDTTKANIDLTGFEVKNVVGRSGRFGQHFVGRAIFLEEHSAQDDIEEILFPIFDNPKLPDEDNIQIALDDLNSAGRNRRKDIIKKCKDYSVPVEILKKNKYVSFENQLELISTFRNEKRIKNDLRLTKSLPNKHQVDIIMRLVHDILFSKSDKKESWTTDKLAKFVKFQLYFNPSIKQLISEYSAAKEDTKIRNVLELIYRYFEYSLPKYIMAMVNLYNFVYEENLSLSLMITHLQYGSNKIQDILLSDAGVPKSIILSLSSKLEGVKSIEDIKNKINRKPSILSELSNIEVKMLSKRV